MSQIRLTTTGTPTTVTIGDLGAVSFVHPTVNFVLYDTEVIPAFTLEQVRDSFDLQAAADAGEITLDDELGNPITDISNAAQVGTHNHAWDSITGTADSIPFNTSLTKPAHAEGLWYYDKDEHAYVGFLDESDITQQIGREFYRRVRNESGATILNGKVVHQSGAEGAGEGRALIDLAQADTEATSHVIGIATHDIENNSYGYITVLGDVNDVDTSTFTAGDLLYLSPTTAGGLTATKPDADEYVVQVATAEIINATTGRYNVRMSNFGRLDDFGIVGGLSYVPLGGGGAVVESNPKDQTVDFTAVSTYFIDGVQYSMGAGGTTDMQSPTDYYATMTNYQHRLVLLYVDSSGTMKTSAGAIVGKNDIASPPAIPASSLCIAIVELFVNSGGTPKDIEDKHIADCRQGFNVPANGDQLKISPDDTTKGYGEDKIVAGTGITINKLNPGANEQLEIVSTASGGGGQVITKSITAFETSLTVPDDNTSPLITEGTELFTQVITPVSASNKVKVELTFNHEIDTDTYAIGTLFRGSVAIGVFNINAKKRGYMATWSMSHVDSPASASAVTYSFRVGSQASKPAILHINEKVPGTTPLFNGLMENTQAILTEIII